MARLTHQSIDLPTDLWYFTLLPNAANAKHKTVPIVFLIVVRTTPYTEAHAGLSFASGRFHAFVQFVLIREYESDEKTRPRSLTALHCVPSAAGWLTGWPVPRCHLQLLDRNATPQEIKIKPVALLRTRIFVTEALPYVVNRADCRPARRPPAPLLDGAASSRLR